MTLWDFHTGKPKKLFHVPGAPLEVRRAWDPNHNYAFAATALASKISLVTKTRMANGCSENASIIPPRYFAPRR